MTNNRDRRHRPVRARTIALARLPKCELDAARSAEPDIDHWRPATRAECNRGPRPCPYVGCRFNLYLDVVGPKGSLKLNFPDLEPGELQVSCALDVADAGGATLDRVGGMLNVTRERIRQLENMALGSFARSLSPLTKDDIR